MSDNKIAVDHDLLTLTTDIVGAFVANNTVSSNELPSLIQSVHGALSGLGQAAVIVAEKQEPAVSVRQSVKHEHIVCLEDGAKLKMLKRYIRTKFDMSTEEYRAKWNLPKDYPMVAPAYAEKRKELAMKIGLGRKKLEAAVVPPVKEALTRVKRKLAVAAV